MGWCAEYSQPAVTSNHTFITRQKQEVSSVGGHQDEQQMLLLYSIINREGAWQEQSELSRGQGGNATSCWKGQPKCNNKSFPAVHVHLHWAAGQGDLSCYGDAVAVKGWQLVCSSRRVLRMWADIDSTRQDTRLALREKGDLPGTKAHYFQFVVMSYLFAKQYSVSHKSQGSTCLDCVSGTLHKQTPNHEIREK